MQPSPLTTQPSHLTTARAAHALFLRDTLYPDISVSQTMRFTTVMAAVFQARMRREALVNIRKQTVEECIAATVLQMEATQKVFKENELVSARSSAAVDLIAQLTELCDRIAPPPLS